MKESVIARFGVLMLPSMTIINNGSIDGQCFVTERSGYVRWETFIQPWLAMGYNCTLDGYQNQGDYHQGTGLKGAMAKQEVDFNLFESTANQLPEVDYALISTTYLYMLSVYNYEFIKKDRGLLNTYLSFHWSYYASIIFSFLIFLFSWSICSKIARKSSKKLKKEITCARKPGYWIMICAILDQDQFPNISAICFSIISLCASLFFYLFIDCFMLNMISTDLVVITEPSVIRSYDDIIRNEDIKIPVVKGSDIETIIKSAKFGTKFEKVAQKVKFVDSNGYLYSQEACEETMERKMVLIWYDWLMVHVGNKYRKLCFDTKFTEKDIRILISKDENEMSIENAFLISKYAPKIVRQYIDKIILEFGTFEFRLKNLVQKTTDEYISYNLDLPDMPDPEIRMIHVKHLFYVSIAFLSIASVVLLIEKFINRIVIFDQEITNSI